MNIDLELFKNMNFLYFFPIVVRLIKLHSWLLYHMICIVVVLHVVMVFEH